MSELIKKEIKIDSFTSSWDGEIIEFTPITKEFGRAEFEICPIWINRKLVKVVLIPAQQPNAKYIYEFIPDNHFWEGITLGGCIDKESGRYEFPHIWDSNWCKEHKSHCLRFYVPIGATKVRISTGLGKFNMNWI
jgi:hypothetical protein